MRAPFHPSLPRRAGDGPIPKSGHGRWRSGAGCESLFVFHICTGHPRPCALLGRTARCASFATSACSGSCCRGWVARPASSGPRRRSTAGTRPPTGRTTTPPSPSSPRPSGSTPSPTGPTTTGRGLRRQGGVRPGHRGLHRGDSAGPGRAGQPHEPGLAAGDVPGRRPAGRQAGRRAGDPGVPAVRLEGRQRPGERGGRVRRVRPVRSGRQVADQGHRGRHRAGGPGRGRPPARVVQGGQAVPREVARASQARSAAPPPWPKLSAPARVSWDTDG